MIIGSDTPFFRIHLNLVLALFAFFALLIWCAHPIVGERRNDYRWRPFALSKAQGPRST